MTAPNAPMSACVHHDFSILDAYVRNLRWSPDTPKEVREAVASNLRGLYSHLLARGLFAGSGSWDDGRTAAAKWVEARRCEYGEKFGVVDPATGALEFGSGYPEREEYYNELSVIEEAVRSLPAPQFVGHKDSAPMSAEEVLAVMDADISRYQVSAEIDALTCSDESAKVLRKRVMTMIQARTAVSAMAERDAALVARVAELEESFTRAGLAAREAQTKAHEATIAMGTAKAEIARLELVQVPALVKEVEALRAAYHKARNAAAGFSNYCPDSANSRRCERDLDEAERMFRAIDAARAESGHD